jgi:basic amino acid/polyamine antiporter, APA family
MLGSGMFVLPGPAIAETGSSVWLAYFISAICVLPAALSKSELATAMPTSGGTYVYLERTFGPLVGTVSGLGLWLSLLLKTAFALIGFGAYLNVLAPSLPIAPVALISLSVITLLNLLGVGKIGKLLITIVATCLAGLFIFGVAGFFSIPDIAVNQGDAFLKFGRNGLLTATAMVFVSFAGVTKVAAIAEEIKNPDVNLPKGIMISLLIVTFYYCLLTYILVQNFPHEQLAGNLRPIYLLGQSLNENWGGIVICCLAILTMTSMANAGILAASRFPFAMSRDNLIPSMFGKLHHKYLTPTTSILASSSIVAASVILLPVEKMAKLASSFIILIYVCENFSVLILREMRVQWYRPKYKTPFYPYIQIFGMVTGLGLFAAMKLNALIAILSISIPGLLIYFIYSQKRINRKGVVGIRGRRPDLIKGPSPFEDKAATCSLDFNREAKVVVGLFGKERSPKVLIEMGAAIGHGSLIEVAHLTEIPEQTDPGDIVETPRALQSLRRRVIAMATEQKIAINFDPIVSYDITKTIFQIGQRLHCEWILIEWAGKNRGGLTSHNPIGWSKNHLDCNLGIFRDAGIRYIRKILAVLSGSNQDFHVLVTAEHLGLVNNAEIVLAKYLPHTATDEEVEKAIEEIRFFSRAYFVPKEILIFRGKDRLATILDATIGYDLLIFGAKEKNTLLSSFFESFDDLLTKNAACSVLSVLGIHDDSIKDDVKVMPETP